MPAFTATEMTRRISALKQALAADDVDVAFLNSADNVFYMSGVPLLSEWGRPMWAILPPNGRSAVCGAAIERENIEKHSSFDEVLTYGDDENVVAASLKLCADFIARSFSGRIRLGIEADIIPLGIYRELQARFPQAEFVEIGPLVSQLRLVKSDEELRLLETGSTLAKIGADAFLDALHDGVTELSVAAHALAEVEKAMGALTDNGLTSSYVYAQFADNTMVPHLHPTSRRLRRGDLVSLNIFPVLWGYCAELERTFVFGSPSKAQQDPLDAVNEAFDAGKAALKPGVVMADIDHLTRGILERHGLDQYIRHGTGHAHGIMIGAASREEKGELRAYNQTRLLPNMANSVEPGVYIPGLGGFRHSDVLLVTETGARTVTDFPRDIIIP
jgi:Xaa-Pro aminopeptidase